jgi:hypothetical protein
MASMTMNAVTQALSSPSAASASASTTNTNSSTKKRSKLQSRSPSSSSHHQHPHSRTFAYTTSASAKTSKKGNHHNHKSSSHERHAAVAIPPASDIHRLMDAACHSDIDPSSSGSGSVSSSSHHHHPRVKWTQILHFLELHTTTTTLDRASSSSSSHAAEKKLTFDSPLPALASPTPALQRELAAHDVTGNSILRRAILNPAGTTPLRIIAALIQLHPQALRATDRKDRIALHLACRLPVCAHNDAVLQLLVAAHPESLLARDEGGRTPLHYLLWFHAPRRSPQIVSTFCSRNKNLSRTAFYNIKQHHSSNYKNAKHYPLPDIPRPTNTSTTSSSSNKSHHNHIPASAAIIPDAMHGCLPLHYAVAGQASIDVIQTLLQAFPLSRHVPDRYGRTAAHWYLGAGHFLSGKLTHVSGEEPNPHHKPYEYRVQCDAEMLKLLLSSRVARTTDWLGRHPLHWACQWMARTHYAHETAKHKRRLAAAKAAALQQQQQQQQAQKLPGATAVSISRNSSKEEQPPAGVVDSSGDAEAKDVAYKNINETTTTTTNSAIIDDDNVDNNNNNNNNKQVNENDDDDLPPPLTTTIIKCVLDPFAGQIFARDYQQKTPIMVFFDTIQTLQQQEYEQELDLERRVLYDEQEEQAKAAACSANNPHDDDDASYTSGSCSGSESGTGNDDDDDDGESSSFYTEDDSRYSTSSRSGTTASASRRSIHGQATTTTSSSLRSRRTGKSSRRHGGHGHHRPRRHNSNRRHSTAPSALAALLPQYDLIHGGPAAVNPDLEFLALLCEHPDYAAIATASSAASTGATQPDGSGRNGNSSHKSATKSIGGLTLPTALEDEAGRLPLHAALQVAASAECINYLIQQHPTSLVHTTEEGFQAPLHAAFSSRRCARLQSVHVIDLLTRPYKTGKHGTIVDGRLALKLEDASGSFPIHYAAQNQAPLAVLQHIIQRYPQAALQQRTCGSSSGGDSSVVSGTFSTAEAAAATTTTGNSENGGDLPVHCLVTPQLVQYLTSVNQNNVFGSHTISTASATKSRARDHTLRNCTAAASPPMHIPGLEVIRQKMRLLLPPLCLVDGQQGDSYQDGAYQKTPKASANKLSVAGSVCKMLPLHIAILFHAAPYSVLLRMLELYPPAAMQFTEAPQCSALDFHELRRQDYYCHDSGHADAAVVSRDWHVIRELLFSFSPTLASHRHRQELLDRCVHIVIDEMNHDPNEDDDDQDKKKSSYHWYNRSHRQGDRKPGVSSRKKCPLEDLELSHSLSEMELAARQQFKIRAPSSSIHHQLEKIRGKQGTRQSVIARLQQRQKQLQALVPLSPLSASTHRTGFLGSGSGSGDGDDVDTGGVGGAASRSLTTGGIGASGSLTDYDGGVSIGAAVSDHGRSVTSASASSGVTGGMSASFHRRRSNKDKKKEKQSPKNSKTGVKAAPSARSMKSIYDEDGIINLIEDLITNISSDEDSDEESSTTSGFGTDVEGEEVALEGDLATCSEGDEEVEDGGSYSTDQGGTTSCDDGTATLDVSSTFGQSMDLSVRWTGSKKVRSTDDDVVDAFDLALMSTDKDEEKKEDYEEVEDAAVAGTPKEGICAKTPRASNLTVIQWAKRRPECLSEVGMRLWTFFALYLDPNNPSDTYVSQVAAIFDEIRFSTVEKIVSMELPTYAASYLTSDRDPEARTFRDIASPKCRELIHKTCFFVGRYDFHTNEGTASVNNQSSGKGMDDNDEDILVQRCHNGQTVVVRAHEWTFTTQEETEAVNPGVSEAAIWKTGEIPTPIGVTFRSHKRDVFIKFTMDRDEYQNEIACRKVLESREERSNAMTHPLLAHYSAFGKDRSADRSYRTDIGDERFKMLRLYPGKEICLGDYPYAMVCPSTITLAGRYARYGVDSVEDAKEICRDVGKALSGIHSFGVIHGDISMQNIALGPSSKPIAERTQWTITNFTKSSIIMNGGQEHQPPCLGLISSNGVPLFSTGTVPPELVVRLTSAELRVYQKYWQNVERKFNAHIDQSAIEPFVDLSTGATYVVRCFFNLPASTTKGSVDLPSLPYSLVTASQAVDIWAFGKLLFELCAGRPLLPIDPRTGRLLDYKLLEEWNTETVESLVFEHVSDPIAQDLLLILLSPIDVRSKLTMAEVMKHIFFQPAGFPRYTQSRAIIEKRREDTAIHKRTLQNKLYEMSEEAWIKPRTFTVGCWDFNFLPRFAMSPSEIVKTMMGRKTDLTKPCSFVALPYKLCRSRNSLLTPKTRKDIEKAEVLGASLLGLSKACHFACVLKKATISSVSYEVAKWTSTELFGIMDLSPNQFGDVQSELASLAAKHVELFRHNPMSVAIKVVKERLQNVLALFQDSDIYVYLVDEYRCLPLVEHPYVVPVGDDRRCELLERCILPMQLACGYARGVAGDVCGLVKLIFEAAYPHAPPSWVDAAAGLSHGLDEESMVDELKLLEDTLTDLFSSRHRIGDDDVSYMHDFCSQMDPKRRMGGLCRVSAGDACLWTTDDGANEIGVLTEAFTLKDALRQQRQVTLKVATRKLSDLDERCQHDSIDKDDDAMHTHIDNTNPWSSEIAHDGSMSTPRSSMDHSSNNQHDEKQSETIVRPPVAESTKENEHDDRSTSPLP